MQFRLSKLLHTLARMLVAVAFMAAAFGPANSASQPASAASACSSFFNSGFQVSSDLYPESIGTYSHYKAFLDQFGYSISSDDPSRDAKSPCCNSFCSSAFVSLLDPNSDALAPIHKDDWPAFVQVLIATDTDHLKRPPRASAG
jgi:hypothetical protein